MVKHLWRLALVGGLILSGIASAGARELTTLEKRCAVSKAAATRKLFRCLARSVVRDIRKDLSQEELDRLTAKCEAKHTPRFERAEARAAAKGGMCVAVGDAAAPDPRVGRRRQYTGATSRPADTGQAPASIPAGAVDPLLCQRWEVDVFGHLRDGSGTGPLQPASLHARPVRGQMR